MSDVDFYESLRAHMPDEAARLIAGRFPPRDELATKPDLSSLEFALKSDMQSLKADMQADMQSLKADMQADMQSLKADMQADMHSLRAEVQELGLSLRADMNAMKAETRGWMLSFFVPLWIGVYGTLAAVIITLIVRG